MKTQKLIIALFVLIVFIPLDIYSQTNLMNRGHSTDDIYVIYDGGTYNYLLYLTSNGELISKRSDNVMCGGSLTADPIPGKIIGHNSLYFFESDDYGQHFNTLPPLPIDYITILGLYGGESPDNYTIQGYDVSVFPYPEIVLYKTTDNFASYTLVADTLNELNYCEGGSIAGELYHIPVVNGHAFLCHSLDYGATSDTLAIDTAIINENLGIEVKMLSHGSAQGELYLVTIQEIAASRYKYIIYHSADYGVSWQMKYFFEENSNRYSFTAGRGACKFYIAIVTTTPGSPYETLTILYSDDCADTFIPYYHLMSPDVGISENLAQQFRLSVYPNPVTDRAKIVSAETSTIPFLISDIKGQVRKSGHLVNGNADVDLNDLKPGLYIIRSGGCSAKIVKL